MEKVWLWIIVATTMFISTEMASVVEIISAPSRVVVMKPRPYEPDMKYGRASWNSNDENAKEETFNNLISENEDLNITLNEDNMKSLKINKNSLEHLEVSSIKETKTNDLRNTKKSDLSSDPQYSVISEELHNSSYSINNETAEEEENATIPEVTCIRRDYEQNIFAIFSTKVGPIKSALMVTNGTRMFTDEDIDTIGEITKLNDTIVDCAQYGVISGDKGLSVGTVAALVGGGG